MTGMITSLRDAAQKRMTYRSMVAELQSLSDRELYDVGIHRSDAARIAREAVYGTR
jgi:uncharacterized protein YjiS (DUF1127 family)